VNTDLSYTCNCNPGYSGGGDATPCQDIDECSTRTPCGAGGSCTNTVGGYSCACNSGYQVDQAGTLSETCTDVDECTSDPTICGTGGTCTNIDGSYTCTCATGYEGGGQATPCTDIDECSTGTPCGAGGSCANTDGGYTCVVTLVTKTRELVLYLKLALKLMNVQPLLASVALVLVLTIHQGRTLVNVHLEQVEVVKLRPVQILMNALPEHLVELVVHVRIQLVVTVVLATLGSPKRVLRLYLKPVPTLMNAQMILPYVVLEGLVPILMVLILVPVLLVIQMEVYLLLLVQILMSALPEHLVALVEHVQT